MTIVAAAALAAAALPALAGDGPGGVLERYFGADWSRVDPADAPQAPPMPATAPQPVDEPFHALHSPVAHMFITEMAFKLYASQYEGGELARYMGGSSGAKPSSDKENTVVEGSYDEDMPHKNPWNQALPELRHFWNCRKGPTAGLFGYDSAVNRAQKYFSGGYGLDGGYDKGWSKAGERRGVKGQGILALYRRGEKGKAFWYLGHAAHLLEDMSVPAHALLFPHPFGLDAYERYMKTHHAQWGGVPSEPVETFDKLYDLFYAMSDASGDFDAGKGPREGADGRKDRGARRAGRFSERQLREEGDVLMPLAYRRTAALFLYFFKQVDHVPPRVTLEGPGSDDPEAPAFAADSRVLLRARAVDDESGVDRRGFRFEVALDPGTGPLAWTPASPASAGPSLELALAPGRRYAVRVWAADAVGNRGVSPARYLRTLPAGPAVAAAR
jgi:hypothetical protein